jgi:hypothetical protein
MYLLALENFFPLCPNVLSFQKPSGVSVSRSKKISTQAGLTGQVHNHYSATRVTVHDQYMLQTQHALIHNLLTVTTT